MNRTVVQAALAACAWICALNPLASGEEFEYKAMQALRTDTAPVIDGVLDDEAWKDAPEFSAFVDTRTDKLSEDQTIVKILYDDKNIYVGWVCMQDPATLVATERKYDRFRVRFEDYVQVGLDTFHDKARAYIFLVSAIGTRWDSRDGVFGRNQSWDADWKAATKVLEDRWIAEMAIPISVMHHDSGPDQTWGINFRRRYAEKDASSHWNYNPGAGVPRRAQGPKFVADFGRIEGLDLSGVKVPLAPQLETFVTLDTSRVLGGNTHTKFESGFDLSLRLSSNWIGTFSVEPNFSEVEADEGDIQNRDTPRFLEERRTFFNEGAEQFRTPLNIYDSRNILDFNVAAKISGTSGKWSEAALILDGSGTRSGKARFLVNRYSQSFGEDAQVGFMFVGADRNRGYNWVGGVDARIALTTTTVWTAQLLYMRDKTPVLETDSDGNEFERIRRLSEHGFVTGFSGGSKPFFWDIGFTDISKEFLPDLSFIPRQDIIGPSVFLRYNLDINEGAFESVSWSAGFFYYKNHQDITTLRDFFVQGSIDLSNNLDFEVWISENFHKPFDNREKGIEIRYNRQNRWKSVEVQFKFGTFEDVPFEQFEFSKPFKIGGRFTTELSGTFRRESPMGREDEDVWLWRTESEYTFQWSGRIKLTLEQSGDHSYQRTLLFAYEDVKRWDFFLELNDLRAPDKAITRRDLFMKFAYRW